MTISAMIEEVHRALQTHGHECPMEDVPALCPEFTWNQVFIAVDYLSRTGQIQVKADSTRGYTVKVLSHTRFKQDPARSVHDRLSPVPMRTGG